MSILKTTQKYIEKYQLEVSPEALFIEFRQLIELHKNFNNFLKHEKLNQKLEKMQRNKRLLEKRRIFAEWYTLLNQNDKMAKEIIIDLSEMAFTSTSTIKKELSKSTTE